MELQHKQTNKMESLPFKNSLVGYILKLPTGILELSVIEIYSFLLSAWESSRFWEPTKYSLLQDQGFPGDTVVKESACQCRRHKTNRFYPWVGKISWSKKWQPTPVFLPGKFHGQRRLVGYNTWGHKEPDTTEHVRTHTHTHTHTHRS